MKHNMELKDNLRMEGWKRQLEETIEVDKSKSLHDHLRAHDCKQKKPFPKPTKNFGTIIDMNYHGHSHGDTIDEINVKNISQNLENDCDSDGQED